MQSPLVRHGMQYGLEAQSRAATAAAAPTKALGGEGGWVAQHVGSPQRLHHRPTAMDVGALLAEPRDATAAQLSSVALERGLLLPPPRAERFIEEVTTDEAVRAALA
mmetsp:Transcript_46921/g.156435  ORF Transcript_46921/g.156435 Transcript_46921/m.156435 type:complete len:107 (+) Transcript_46921:145-465(+)